MEKVKGSLERNFNPVRIDLDDYFEIVSLLKDHYENLSITAAGFQLQTPDEIKDLHLPQLRVVGQTHD